MRVIYIFTPFVVFFYNIFLSLPLSLLFLVFKSIHFINTVFSPLFLCLSICIYVCIYYIFLPFSHPSIDPSTSAGSWHVLFAVLCEEFENARLVWNESTLRHLYDCLHEACRHLDMQRAVRFGRLLYSFLSLLLRLIALFLLLIKSSLPYFLSCSDNVYCISIFYFSVSLSSFYLFSSLHL